MEDANNPTNISATPAQGEGNSEANLVVDQTNPILEDRQPEKTVEPQGSNRSESRTVPFQALAEERQRRKELQREIAQLRSSANRPQFNADDLEAIRNHPYVQELELKQAEGELRQGAEEILSRYPSIPPQVKKAILRNPRGYVATTTSDVPNALLDIEQYIEEISQELAPEAPQPKQVPVAGMNKPAATQGSMNPADIQAILKKPVDEWTPEETRKLDAYKAANL